ncbi:putative D-xylose 1-dehydrogenase (NADP(+)) [[Candida] jaroonii]|uniref:D-xylose 1-dehydrogenase (NADP(+)) n=1 Tax=[Candida] jaroonii TaxID=467808 RepID=A0ACA9YC20_9ASCO|nr:putative D-xylose 1-dehydrogenase (NADP(+)) [[Candida] jaroonii]
MSVNWGIIGAGIISGRFVEDIVKLHNYPQGPNQLVHTIKGVGCSSADKAKSFIEKHLKDEASKHNPVIGSYDEIFDNVDIDAVYIGVLHPFHKELSIKALKKGKHVLCEKPVTMNAGELEDIIEVAKKTNKLFMEAMWVRFFPTFVALQKMVHEDKVIGEVKRVYGNYSFNADVGADHRVVNKKLGGSALLDIGIYSLTFNRLFLNPNTKPSDWTVHSDLLKSSFTGNKEDEVDFISTVLINTGKQHGIATSSMFNAIDEDGTIAIIEGELGKITVKAIGLTPSPRGYKLELKTGETSEKDFDFGSGLEDSEGFYLQAVELGERVLAGDIQSNVIPWEESLNMMRLFDKIRADNGVVFPQDK